jgi:hypothetical protein
MKRTFHVLLARWPLLFAALLMLPVLRAKAANALQYGQPVNGTLAAGQQAEYTFDGKAGDKPVISMNAHGGSMIPYVELYDPQGHLIGEDSNGGTKGDALLKGTVLAADGTYKVEAVNKAPSGSGNYGLEVSEEKVMVYYDQPAPTGSAKQDYQLSQPWNHTNITYHIINTLSQFSPQDVTSVIAQAFQSWASVAPLTFTQVNGTADINIQFASIDGPENILGETCPPYNPCDSGSVTLDSDETWALTTPQGYSDISLLAVASHELGHAIGMLHTNDQNALMYPEYSPYVLAPAQDDIAGVQRLYGVGGAGPVTNPSSPTANNPPATNGQMLVSGTLDDTHYTHFWDFDVVAGDTATITMDAASGDLDSFLVLLDANNNVIAYDDDSDGGKNARLANLKFPQTGTYTVAATRYAQAQGYTSGTYNLSIQYDVGAGNSAPTTAANNNPPVSGIGSVKASAPQSGQLDSLPSLDSVLQSPFADSAAPDHQNRNGTVSTSQSYAWEETWCATDNQTLASGLANITVTFAINGTPVDPSAVTQADTSQNQLSCKEYGTVLSGWSPGNVTLTATLTLKQAVFDGQTIYPPGDYVYEYDIAAS